VLAKVGLYRRPNVGVGLYQPNVGQCHLVTAGLMYEVLYSKRSSLKVSIKDIEGIRVLGSSVDANVILSVLTNHSE
jgi:hypothetical protein